MIVLVQSDHRHTNIDAKRIQERMGGRLITTYGDYVELVDINVSVVVIPDRVVDIPEEKDEVPQAQPSSLVLHAMAQARKRDNLIVLVYPADASLDKRVERNMDALFPNMSCLVNFLDILKRRGVS